MTIILVWDNRVLEQTEDSFVWGSNLTQAAEFDNTEQMKMWISEEEISDKFIKFVPLPDRIKDQKQLATKYKLQYKTIEL